MFDFIKDHFVDSELFSAVVYAASVDLTSVLARYWSVVPCHICNIILRDKFGFSKRMPSWYMLIFNKNFIQQFEEAKRFMPIPYYVVFSGSFAILKSFMTFDIVLLSIVYSRLYVCTVRFFKLT